MPRSAEAIGGRWHLAAGWLRVAVPGLLAMLAVSSRSADAHGHLSLSGVAAGLLVVVGTVLVARVARRRAAAGARTEPTAVLARVNTAVTSVVAVGSVWLFADSARVVAPGGASASWGYVPAWLALAVLVGLLVGSFLRGRTRDPATVERNVLTYVGGGALVFLMTSHLAPGVHHFVGFDDGQGLVGADLLGRGLFPWRDFLLVHGLFDDALRPAAGFELFGHTVWGAQTATLALWAPACWIGLYLLAGWAARGRITVLVALALPLLALADAWQDQTFSFVRWVGTPLVLLALAAALGDRRPVRRTVLLTTILFADAILVPEASFLVLAVAVVLVLSDVTRRSPEDRWLPRLRRTGTFLATGAVLTLAWAVFLLAHGALGDFVSYFVVFVPDHNATGAVEVTHVRAGFPLFVLLGVWVFTTLLLLGHRLLSGRTLSVRSWVLAAATLFAGLYGEKALGRFDQQHIFESFFGGLPMMIVGAALGLSWLDDRLTAALGARQDPGSGPPVVLRPVSGILALLMVLVSVGSVLDAPAHNKVALASMRSDPFLGYDAAAGHARRTAADLGRALTALDPDGPVFDFSNSPGYVHFLLQRRPATRFTNVALALTPPAQRLLLDELRDRPPAVVVFDSGSLGASRWDHISNDVRTYAVAQYLLDGWTPVRSVAGFLLMVRDDLVGRSESSRLPSADQLRALYTSTPACAWGYSANYLSSTATGRRLVLPLSPVGTEGVDRVSVARIPPGVDLADYALAGLEAGARIGHAHVILSDQPGRTDRRHEIRLRVLPFSGSRIDVRVGSCLQWHGYAGHRLYVTQTHGRPVTRLVLSGVR